MNSLPRSSRTLHLRHRDLSSAGGSQSVTSVSVVRPMQRLTARIANAPMDVVQECGTSAGAIVQGRATEVRSSSMSRPVRALKAVTIPLEAMYPGTASAAAEAVASDVLLKGCKTVPIMHNGEQYTLRATKHGKLILTK